MKQPPKISVGELAEWIIENRKGAAFEGDSFETLCGGLFEDIKNNNLLYVLDNDVGEIIGIMSFIPDRTNKILFVRNILITKHSALVIFAQHFRVNFDGFQVAGNRFNQTIMYNTARLVGHILKGGY